MDSRLFPALLSVLIGAVFVPGAGGSTPQRTEGPAESVAPILKGVSRARTVKGTSIALRRPARVGAGDVLVAGIGVRARSLRPPAGWKLIRADANRGRGVELTNALYYHVAAAREPAVYRWRFAFRRSASGGLLAYQGVDAAQPVLVHSGRFRARSRAAVAPGVTASAARVRVVGFFAASGRGSMSLPRGMARRYAVTGLAGRGATALAADFVQTVPRATGTRVARLRSRHGGTVGQLVVLRSASISQPPPPPGPGCAPIGEPAPIAGQGYTVRLDECFNAIDPARWRRAMHWEPEEPSDVFTDASGILHIQSRRSEGYPNRSLSTLGTGTGEPRNVWKFGYFEARFHLPAGVGSNPAFWLMAASDPLNPNHPGPPCPVPPAGDPRCLSAELDIFEHFPVNGVDDFETTLHRNTSGRWGVPDQTRSVFAHPGVNLGAGYHTYAAKWTPTQVCSYLDQIQLGCLVPWDSINQDMFLTLYEWTRVFGPPPNATTPDVLDMRVDWVRVWQLRALDLHHSYRPPATAKSFLAPP
jgi:beta-glucanase (GH16 family)